MPQSPFALSRYEKAELAYREFEYRHSVVWKMVQLWSAITIVLIIAPFVQKGKLFDGTYSMIPPIIGFLVSMVGSWSVSAEYARMMRVSAGYDKLRGFSWPFVYDEPKGPFQRAVATSAGEMLRRIMFWGLGSACIASTLVTAQLNAIEIACWVPNLIYVALGVLALGFVATFRGILFPVRKRPDSTA